MKHCLTQVKSSVLYQLGLFPWISPKTYFSTGNLKNKLKERLVYCLYHTGRYYILSLEGAKHRILHLKCKGLQ